MPVVYNSMVNCIVIPKYNIISHPIPTQTQLRRQQPVRKQANILSKEGRVRHTGRHASPLLLLPRRIAAHLGCYYF